MRRSRRNKPLRWLRKHYGKILGIAAGAAVLLGGAYVATRKTPEDHLRAGIALQAKGDIAGATIELKNALQMAPDNARARFLLGEIHMASGNYPNAEKELAKAREMGLAEPRLVPLLAHALMLTNQPRRVLDEIKPGSGGSAEADAAILALRARAHLLLGGQAAAEESLSQAEALSPGHPESHATRAYMAHQQGRLDAALAQADLALAKAKDRADLWVVKANLLQALKRNTEALAAFEQALALMPGNVPAHLAVAQLRLQDGDLAKTEAALKALRKYAPDNLVGRYLEALVDVRRGRLAEADGKLQDVVRSAPSFPQGHLLAAMVNLSLGKREEARARLNKLLELDPQHALARKLLASTLTDLGDLTQAKEVLASFAKSGNDPTLNLLHGEIALRQRHFAEARKYLESVPEGEQRDAKYYASLAASRSGSGDEAGAVEALAMAADLDTSSNRPEMLLVMAHLRAKRFDAAQEVVDKLARERPEDPLIHNLRGGIHLAREDRQQARASFASALKMDPGYFPAAYSLARLDLQEKNEGAARARFEQLLKHAPKESRAWLALANMDALKKNEAGYLRNLENAVAADGKSAQARQLLARYWLARNNPAKAQAEARAGLEATGQAGFHEIIGQALNMQGDHVNALAAYKQWAQRNPASPLAQLRLAQGHLAVKDREAALKALDRALALRPDFTEAAISKALLLAQMGQGEEALKLARSLQARLPKAGAGYVTEAEIHYIRKHYPEAGKLFAKAAQVTGQGALLGRAYQAYSQAGQAAEGEAQYAQWLKSHPGDARVRHMLAATLLAGKRLTEAAEHYRVLIQAQPRDLMALNNLAWILGELKDPTALATAERAYKLNPDNPATLDTLGWILVNGGQAKRGVDLLAKAVAKAPGAMEIHWHLAAGLARAGDRTRARQELEKLLEKGKTFPQEAEARKLLDSLR